MGSIPSPISRDQETLHKNNQKRDQYIRYSSSKCTKVPIHLGNLCMGLEETHSEARERKSLNNHISLRMAGKRILHLCRSICFENYGVVDRMGPLLVTRQVSNSLVVHFIGRLSLETKPRPRSWPTLSFV